MAPGQRPAPRRRAAAGSRPAPAPGPAPRRRLGSPSPALALCPAPCRPELPSAELPSGQGSLRLGPRWALAPPSGRLREQRRVSVPRARRGCLPGASLPAPDAAFAFQPRLPCQGESGRPPVPTRAHQGPARARCSASQPGLCANRLRVYVASPLHSAAKVFFKNMPDSSLGVLIKL